MQPVRYLPPSEAPTGFAGPQPVVLLEGRAGEPFRAERPGEASDRTARRARLPVPLRTVSPDADHFLRPDSGFLTQRLAQERRGNRLHIDRSAEGARAYDVRAGYSAAHAAKGGQVNIAV